MELTTGSIVTPVIPSVGLPPVNDTMVSASIVLGAGALSLILLIVMERNFMMRYLYLGWINYITVSKQK